MRSYHNALRAIGDGNDQQTRDYDERIVGGFAGLGSSEEGKANVKNTWQRTIRSGTVNMLNNSLSSVSHVAPKQSPPPPPLRVSKAPFEPRSGRLRCHAGSWRQRRPVHSTRSHSRPCAIRLCPKTPFRYRASGPHTLSVERPSQCIHDKA